MMTCYKNKQFTYLYTFVLSSHCVWIENKETMEYVKRYHAYKPQKRDLDFNILSCETCVCKFIKSIRKVCQELLC